MEVHRLSLLVNRRQRRRERQHKSLHRRVNQVGLGCGFLFSVFLVFSLVLSGVFYVNLTSNLPSLETLPVLLNSLDGQLLQPTRLYDRSGEHLLVSLDNPNITRRYLSIDPALPDHISPKFVQASLSILDPTFWQSSGVSWTNWAELRPVTIAERLVSDLLLERESPGLRRALRMRLLAAQLVSQYGRASVLEWYLNSAYFGHLAYGVESASQLYFGKPAGELTLAESIMLVAVIDAPALNPLDAQAAATERQQALMDDLLARGIVGMDEYVQMKHTPLKFNALSVEQLEIARAFDQLVMDELAARFGRQRVERGGLRVITTLDYDLQLQMVCTLRTQLLRVGQISESEADDLLKCDSARLLPTLSTEAFNDLSADLEASTVVLDPKTGQILAMMGDTSLRGEANSLAEHQPGSLLTPFVALTAFTRGLSPASLVWDIPPGVSDDHAVFTNPDGSYHGPLRLRMALANDYLVPLTNILLQISPSTVWQLVETLGLKNLANSSRPADLLYEGGSVTILEAAHAYSTFANMGEQSGQPTLDGSLPRPVSFLWVEDTSGQPWLDNTQSISQAVLSPQLAYLVHNILSDEAARWPSLGYPNAMEIGRPAGAKSGQIESGLQAWTVGYTPERLVGVWMGFPESQIAEQYRVDPKMAAGIWHALMQYSTRNLPVSDWSMPDGITRMEVCDPSGKLLTADCPTPVTEYFLSGNEPHDYDDLYQVLQINRETDRLATVFTPLELIEEKTFLMVPPEARTWAVSAGLPMPPTAYDSIQAPPRNPDVNITAPVLFSYLREKVSLIGTADGDQFSSYRIQVGQGLNPRTWLQIGQESSQAVSNGLLGSWDTTQDADGLYAIRLIVLRQDQRIDTAIMQVTVDNTPPETRLPYPLPGQVFSLKTDRQITLQADVKDAVGIDRVEWYLNDRVIGEAKQAPYTFLWQPVLGKHRLQIRAYDLAGNESQSETLSFEVSR